MTEPFQSPETAWLFTRKLCTLDDTNDARMAFFSGAQHILNTLRGMDLTDTEALQELNNEVQAFGRSARIIRALADLTDLREVAHARVSTD